MAYPALIPQRAMRASVTHWANSCRAYGAGLNQESFFLVFRMQIVWEISSSPTETRR